MINNYTNVDNGAALNTRALVYSLVLSIGLTVPVLSVLVLQSQSALATYPCLSFLGNYNRLAGCILSILTFVVALPASYLAFTRLPAWLNQNTNHTCVRFFDFSFCIRSVLRLSLFIVICWMPYIIMYFPGITTGFDTISQIFQFMTPPPTYHGTSGTFVDADFLNDNPVFDTLVFGSFISLGRTLGSDTFGMFLYCFTQAITTAISFSIAICYLHRLRIRWSICACCLIFVCLFPPIPIAAYSMIKDSLFSMVFLLYTLCFIEAFRSEGKALKSPLFLLAFIVVSCLCALTKTTGVYVVTLCAVILVVALKGQRLLSLVLCATPYIICAILIPMLIFPILDVGKTPIKGTGITGSGFMYQQCIAVLKNHPEALSDREYAILDAIIDVKKAKEDYDPHVIDGVSKTARWKVSSDQRSDFLKLWISLGAKFPREYLFSYLRVVDSLIVPSKQIVLEQGISQKGIDSCSRLAGKVGNEFHLDAKNPEATHVWAERLNAIYTENICKIPVLSLFTTMGFYGIWVPLICSIGVIYFRKKGIIALAPAILSALVLFVCPSPLARYIFPSVYIVIPTIGWMMYCAKESMQNPVNRPLSNG